MLLNRKEAKHEMDVDGRWSEVIAKEEEEEEVDDEKQRGMLA